MIILSRISQEILNSSRIIYVSIKNRLNFVFNTFQTLRKTLNTTRTSILDYSKKITIINTPFVKKTISLITILFCTIFLHGNQTIKQEDSLRLLFDKNFQPQNKLVNLLKILGMQETESEKSSLDQINDWAQKNLLRRNERWDEQTTKFEPLKQETMPLLEDLGFVKATFPHFKTYQGAIVHGALLSTVRLRLNYLIQQWEKGIRFNELYFLSSERRLEERETKALINPTNSPLKIRQDWNKPIKLPQTENEMIQLVWEQSEIPNDMRQIKVNFINAPMKQSRPNTEDTIKEWLKNSPSSGTYLVISNAPYRNRQDLVMQRLVMQGNALSKYNFDTVGSEAGEIKIIIFLDELARFIYEAKQISEKKRN